MFNKIKNIFQKLGKKNNPDRLNKDEAKERLHLVLLQDRANVSADFLDMMKQEIIEVIKKYIDIDEKEMDVKLTNKQNSDGTTGAPALYANIPIVGIKSETRKKTNKIKLQELDEEAKKNEKNKKQENNKTKVEKNKTDSKNNKVKNENEKKSNQVKDADKKESDAEAKKDDNKTTNNAKNKKVSQSNKKSK